jgi:hypothetical protein
MAEPLHVSRRYALLAAALLAPSVCLAQTTPLATGDTTSCFAQPRVQRDSARPPVSRERAGAQGGARGADIILLASVSARELRFYSQPRISVRLCGGLDSVRVVERRNLPERVVPGVTYRDVHVAVEIVGHILAECLRGDPAACGPAADTTRPAPRRPR